MTGKDALSRVAHQSFCDYSECNVCQKYDESEASFSETCSRLEDCFNALRGVELQDGASVRELVGAAQAMLKHRFSGVPCPYCRNLTSALSKFTLAEPEK